MLIFCCLPTVRLSICDLTVEFFCCSPTCQPMVAKMSDFYGVSSPRQTNLSLYYYYMNLLLVCQECDLINYLPHHITYFQHLCLLTFRKASTPECSFLHQRNAQSSLFTFHQVICFSPPDTKALTVSPPASSVDHLHMPSSSDLSNAQKTLPCQIQSVFR